MSEQPSNDVASACEHDNTYQSYKEMLEIKEAVRRAKRIADMSVLDYLRELVENDDVWKVEPSEIPMEIDSLDKK